jgi:LuxR family transcriptional regulator, maltose regulon positive regulatory protein
VASPDPGDRGPEVVALAGEVDDLAWLAAALAEAAVVEEAARRSSARGWDALDDLRYHREREHLAMARVLLAQGRADQAAALLARLHGPALAQDRTGSLIEIQALRALALAAAGDEPSALSALAAAVALAQPEGHVRVFSDEGLAEPLTEREMDVLELLAAGSSNQQIADHLFVALVTVKTHVSHILDKLGAANRTEAVARARGLGLLR